MSVNVKLLALLAAAVFFGAPAVAGQEAADVAIGAPARKAIDAGLAFLAKTQQAGGAWPSGDFGQPTAVASLAGLAFMSDGSVPGRGKYAANVSRSLDYVLGSSQPTGLLEYGTPHTAMYSHGFSTLFLAEAWGMTGDTAVRDRLKAAVDLIVKTQNREGGWRYQPKVADADISVTVCQIVALRAAANAGLSVPRETVDSALSYLGKCARPDGGFSYQAGGGESAFPRTAGALLCMALAGPSDSPSAANTVRYLTSRIDYDGRYYFYGQYYGAQGIHLAAPSEWPKWYGTICAQLAARQSSDGSWSAPGEDKYQCTSMAVLILTIPNGYLPLYQR